LVNLNLSSEDGGGGNDLLIKEINRVETHRHSSLPTSPQLQAPFPTLVPSLNPPTSIPNSPAAPAAPTIGSPVPTRPHPTKRRIDTLVRAPAVPKLLSLKINHISRFPGGSESGQCAVRSLILFCPLMAGF